MAITAIDLEDETTIASFPQSLYFGISIENSLIPPSQFWGNNVVVDLVPKQYSNRKSLHGIYMRDEDVQISFNI